MVNRNIKTIDILYDTFSYDENACLYQLKQKRKRMYDLLLRDRMRNSEYEILDRKISEYESKIYSEINKQNDEGENQDKDSDLPVGVS